MLSGPPSRLRLTDHGYRIATTALRDWFDGKKTHLAQDADVDRGTVVRFFKKINLEFQSFDAICVALQLQWQDVGEDPLTSNGGGYSIPDLTSPTERQDSETLARQARDCIRSRIKHDCDTMQLLVLHENVKTAGIYINTDLIKLQQSEVGSVANAENLQGEIDLDNFDRLGIRVSKTQRISGDDAALNHTRLFVFGKPGSGKTTYLQWLAIRCSEGSFLPGWVPVFLSFKDFSEAENRPSLQTYIEQYFAQCQVENATTVANRLLAEGRILLLMDGLDEVQEGDRNRVQGQILEIIARFTQCRFIFSCRPPLNLRLPNFEKVLVADFDRYQVNSFAKRWFKIIDGRDRSKLFMDRLSSHVAIAELARTPLLLTLLCVVFDTDGFFPRSRSDLYRRGFEILLNQWDEFRNVERNNPYRLLNPRAKEALLSHIANRFFWQQKILFWRRDVEQLIEDFFHKAYKIDRLRIPSQEILEAMEQQHGLIVTRASNYCSFSHLTFQEYLTANYLVQAKKHELVFRHILEPRWRFVIELIAELLDDPVIDDFVVNFKRSLDQSIQSHSKIREFLQWLNTFVVSLSQTVRTEQRYKQTLLRAKYFVSTLEETGSMSSFKQLSKSPLEFPDYYVATSMITNETLELHALLYRAFHAGPDQADLFLKTVNRIHQLVQGLDAHMETSIESWLLQIQQQQVHHPNAANWWQYRIDYWKRLVQQFMNRWLNLRCDWSFTDEERQLLRRYYEATRLLAECINRSQKVSEDTYQTIATSLLQLGMEHDL